MGSTVYEIDPDGDVLLILLNPNTPFAVWDESDELPSFSAPNSCESMVQTPDPGPEGNKSAAKCGILSFELVDPASSSVSAFMSEPLSEPQVEPVIEPMIEPEPPEDSLPEEEIKVHMRLSSKHLKLASSYFKKMFTSPWKESIASDNACYTINESEWDAEAMLILMNILHGRVRSVPRIISLEMLAKIAVLVDYYKCHEAVELFTEFWIQNLQTLKKRRRRLPRVYGRDAILWLTISWVFSQGEIFEAMTELAVHDSKGPLQTLILPIPRRIVEAIDQRREAIIDDVTSGLQNLISYFYKRTNCTFECSSGLLGALARQMQMKGLLNPQPTIPFLGWSVTETVKTVRDLKSLNCCTLASFTEPIITNGFTNVIKSFNLNDFHP